MPNPIGSVLPARNLIIEGFEQFSGALGDAEPCSGKGCSNVVSGGFYNMARDEWLCRGCFKAIYPAAYDQFHMVTK